MRKFLLGFFSVLFLTAPAFANHSADHKAPAHVINVKVNGMVCDFCIRSIEKVMYQQTGVEGVIINMDEHLVKLETSDAATLTDEEITKLITAAGYSVVEIQRQ